MTRAEAIGIRIADKLFAGRRGHGNSERIVERHLRYGQVKEIVMMAYDLGFQDGTKQPKEPKVEA